MARQAKSSGPQPLCHIVETVWPTQWYYILWICPRCNFMYWILTRNNEKPHCAGV